MKRLAVAMLAVAMVATMGFAATEVYSVNVVGYKTIDFPSGLALVSCPFVKVGDQASDLTIDEMFGTDAPDGTIIYLFTGTGYKTYTWVEGDSWYDDDFNPNQGTNVLFRGEGFWVRAPSVFSKAVTGEVPGEANPTNSIVLPAGLSLFSFGFPVDVVVGDTGLAPSDGDIIYKFQGGTYATFTYVEGDGWYDDDFNLVDVDLTMGESYWYRAGAQTAWDQVKPYTEP